MTPRPAIRTDRLRTVAGTLALAVAGGFAFWICGFPAPWLAGGAVAVAAGAMRGLPIGVPDWLRDTAFVFLGLSMGASVTPETVAALARWPLSLLALAVCVALIMIVITQYLQRVHGYDPATARGSAIPGALSYVVAVAADTTADVRRVAMLQGVRIIVLVVLVPPLLTLLGVAHTTAPAAAAAATGSPVEIAIILAAGVAAGYVCGLLKVPAPYLFGAALLSGVLHGAGLITAQLPVWLLIPGFLITGAVIGVRFEGLDIALLKSTLPASFLAILIGAAISLALAALTGWWLGLPVAQVWLAFAPGGLEAMAVMAIALDVDPAFVGTHHVARFIGLALVVPFWLRAYMKPRRNAGGGRAD